MVRVPVSFGGVGSVAGGGKFENGAETGAFGYLFNAVAHEVENERAESSLGKKIDAYITEHAPGSPMIGYGKIIVEDSIKFGVDPTFITGIADAETTFGLHITSGRFNVFNNLFAGRESNFDSLNTAIYSEAKMIGRSDGNYFGQGLYSAQDIYAVYCKGGDCHNGLRNITTTMKTLGGNPNDARDRVH